VIGPRPSPAGSPRARRLAETLLLAASGQAAFLWPPLYLAAGCPENLFTALLCALALAAALLAAGGGRLRRQLPEAAVSVALLALALAGAAASRADSAFPRAAVVVTPMLGGFWTARLLLRDSPDTVRRFAFATCWALLAMSALAGLGHILFASAWLTLDVNPHPVAARIVLLSFAPLAIVAGWPAINGRGPHAHERPAGDCSRPDGDDRQAHGMRRAAGCVVLSAAGVALYLMRLRSALLIVPLAVACAAAARALRFRYLVIAAVAACATTPIFFRHFPERRVPTGEYEPIYYRAENYPFTLHAIRAHPWLGVGFRAPREDLVRDYRPRFALASKSSFAASARRIVTSENSLLTFAVDAGLPFAALYAASVAVLFGRLIRPARPDEVPPAVPRVALLVPLAAVTGHLMLFDGLLLPQVSWFFHVLLGLIPAGLDNRSSKSAT
jgi:hypothetical protein